MLTASSFQLATGVSNALRDAWFPHIAASLSAFQISTPLRQAHFLAQTGHESAGFLKVEEGLNYSENALTAMFGKRITAEQARAYGRNAMHVANQKMIASIIYANRNGNGDVDSGDGYRYRGRGLIQITGKANYAALVKQLGADVVANPDLLLGYRFAAMSAAAWWKNHGLNELADSDDVLRITRIINGGTNGLDDRKSRLSKSKGILCST
ncbi:MULTISPECIES: glycoside hydrolase family 19 protein [Pantoea]|jgi:putative chitinase|uniref:glycoside hydrolase family 19 protein n=1 Tax=Pantoea TaxID=53335 RepID=UPI0015F95B37|nr:MULTISPECIES: glycoside hydrolase family 19 protein [Pantoea]MDF2040837.1 glycoside hydrolase family 19 protein [Pantoea sp. Cr_R14]MDF2071244.1 glycoside hydrolase family 19 protein [Pantoea sp. Cr_R13]MDF2080373.1 glycoside hydrolase family 19 protein [Pantoea sp. Cr_R21]